MCMRASGASELRKFWHFTLLNCYFFQYFVGTSDTLSVQMTCLSAYMYRQISKCTDKFSNVPTKLRKSIIGGGGGSCPPAPPPSGYANACIHPPPPPRSISGRFTLHTHAFEPPLQDSWLQCTRCLKNTFYTFNRK